MTLASLQILLFTVSDICSLGNFSFPFPNLLYNTYFCLVDYWHILGYIANQIWHHVKLNPAVLIRTEDSLICASWTRRFSWICFIGMITRNRFINLFDVSIRFNLYLSVIPGPDCIFQLMSLLKVFCYCLPATQARAFESPSSCWDVEYKNDSDDQWLSSNTSLTHHEVKQPSK